MAKRHQKFRSARGYGPCVVQSRCPCLAWRSLFSAVPFWPLLAPLALLAPFGRDECVTVAKRHQKFPSARGYGPFMVPSRCPCLAWRSLFGAVPFWPLLVPFTLLAPFGPFWPLLAPFALMAPFRLLWASWPLVCILRTPRHNNYCPIRVLGANGPGLVY